MRCYFLHDSHIVGVAMLPPGLSERVAIAHARALTLKRMRPIDTLEVWDGPHLIIRRLVLLCHKLFGGMISIHA
jgi:hypothetical protein